MIAEVLMLIPHRITGAEQAGRAPGEGQRRRHRADFPRGNRGTRNPRWSVLLLEAAAETILEDLRAKHASPPIRFYTDNSFYTDIYTDKSDYTDKNTDKTLEDQNHNGRIEGDNGDGIYETTESWSETSPKLADSDGDTLTDSFEKTEGYDPLSQDSDNDGLSDIEEDIDKDGILDEGETDPTLMDTDNDGMSDKMELDGWTISIVYEATREHKTKYSVSSNPRLLDTDSDGMPDFDEYKNVTDPTKADTDGDGKTDHQELTGDYNSSATGIDGEPPTIWKFDCSYQISYDKFLGIKVPSGLKVSVEVGVNDIFGLNYIAIYISGLPDVIKYCNNAENVTKDFEWELSGIDQYARAFTKGFKINLTAKDRNGNIGFKNDELKSIAEIVVSAFLGALLAIAKFVSELASGIFNWIYTTISDILTTPLNIIQNLMKSMGMLIINLIIPFIENIVNNNNDHQDAFDNFIDNLFINNPLFWGLMIINVVITVIALIITPFTNVISTLISLVIKFTLPFLISFIGGLIGGPFGAITELLFGDPIVGFIKVINEFNIIDPVFNLINEDNKGVIGDVVDGASIAFSILDVFCSILIIGMMIGGIFSAKSEKSNIIGEIDDLLNRIAGNHPKVREDVLINNPMVRSRNNKVKILNNAMTQAYVSIALGIVAILISGLSLLISLGLFDFLFERFDNSEDMKSFTQIGVVVLSLALTLYSYKGYRDAFGGDKVADEMASFPARLKDAWQIALVISTISNMVSLISVAVREVGL